MGREARILLTLLGLLVGVFVGVLSMKLLVPRPPAGAGVDIHDEMAAVSPADIVEPPALSPPADPPLTAPETADRYAAPSRFSAVADTGADATDATDAEDEPAPARDPFVARADFTEPSPLAAEVEREAKPIAVADAAAAQSDGEAPPPAAVAAPPVMAAGFAPAAAAWPPARQSYVTAVGDSWWSLAERTYGDGRLYRALFAWNRAVNPRVSLVPGTTLELPSRARLAAAWPALIPGE